MEAPHGGGRKLKWRSDAGIVGNNLAKKLTANSHERCHTKSTSDECEECGKELKKKKDLRGHKSVGHHSCVVWKLRQEFKSRGPHAKPSYEI